MTERSDAPSLEEAMPAAQRGERWAEDLLASEVAVLARIVCAKGQAPDLGGLDWEDVSQEACQRFFAVGLHRYRGDGSVRSYLYSIVKVTMLQMLRGASRRRIREQAAVDPEGGPNSLLLPDQNDEVGQRRRSVQRILAALGPECQELIVAMFLQGASYREVAEESGLAESSVRSKLSRCLRRAREQAS